MNWGSFMKQKMPHEICKIGMTGKNEYIRQNIFRVENMFESSKQNLRKNVDLKISALMPFRPVPESLPDPPRSI